MEENTAMSEPELVVHTGAIEVASQGNKDIRRRVEKLAVRSLEIAEKLIEEGNPMMQMTVVKSVLPPLIRALEQQNQNDQLDEMRAEMRAMRKEMLEQDSIVTTAHVSDVRDDSPDPPAMVSVFDEDEEE